MELEDTDRTHRRRLSQTHGLHRMLTKNRRKLEYLLDPECACIVQDYLAHSRPHLQGASETDLLWMGTNGRPLTDIGVTGVVRRRNRDFIQKAEGPHTARKWLTDTARKRSPEAAFDCAEVLGHSPQTALKNYAQAEDTHAGRRHGQGITRRRRKTTGLARRAFAEKKNELMAEWRRASTDFKPASPPALEA